MVVIIYFFAWADFGTGTEVYVKACDTNASIADMYRILTTLLQNKGKTKLLTTSIHLRFYLKYCFAAPSSTGPLNSFATTP
jgi:hypothetical protein